jgi:hypothetical protein
MRVLSSSERAEMDVGVDEVKGFLFRQSRYPIVHLFHWFRAPQGPPESSFLPCIR